MSFFGFLSKSLGEYDASQEWNLGDMEFTLFPFDIELIIILSVENMLDMVNMGFLGQGINQNVIHISNDKFAQNVSENFIN